MDVVYLGIEFFRDHRRLANSKLVPDFIHAIRVYYHS